LDIYNSSRGGESIKYLICSNDNVKIRNGIERLSYEVELKGIQNHLTDYKIITNMIILRNTESIETCFRHLMCAIKKYQSKFHNQTFIPLFQSILTCYWEYYKPIDARSWDVPAEKDVFEKLLIQLAELLESWGYSKNEWKHYKPIYY